MEVFELKVDNTKQLAIKTSKVLASGGVAIIPTDTVYGIVCDGLNIKAKEKIFSIKKRSYEKPLIGFVDKVNKAERFACMPQYALPFIRKRWPGATTFIFKSRENLEYMVTGDGKIAFRIPNYNFIREVTKHFEVVASTSANISGENNPTSVEEMPDTLKKMADIVISAGDIERNPSALWDATKKPPCLLRGKILFVCLGNTCRSPIAEHLLKEMLKNTGIQIGVESAGLSISSESTADPLAYIAMAEKGIDMGDFVSRQLTPYMAKNFDLIYVMEEAHRNKVLSHFPNVEDKVTVLGVEDPFGESLDFYRRITEKMSLLIKEVVLPRLCCYEPATKDNPLL
jgi:tRNA threonylcarbamoyl adenosine modification protein (Sua5/YciO/YrdC/YwlC family)